MKFILSKENCVCMCVCVEGGGQNWRIPVPLLDEPLNEHTLIKVRGNLRTYLRYSRLFHFIVERPGSEQSETLASSNTTSPTSPLFRGSLSNVMVNNQMYSEVCISILSSKTNINNAIKLV